MRIDLHTHSRASDGTQSPADVMRSAAEAGLDVVALTDHDTAQGWAEAAEAADSLSLELVTGIEVSTRFEHAGVHLLAYLPDAEDDVRRVAAGTPATGRPHVADALVARGVVADRAEAFERFLNPGRPGYASRYAAELEDIVPVVVAAGGVPVVAHPWARSARRVLTEAAFARLQELGLAGIEVDHQGHDAAAREQLRGIASNLGLIVTGSSDYHGAGKVDHDLGCNTTAPDELARIRELALWATGAGR